MRESELEKRERVKTAQLQFSKEGTVLTSPRQAGWYLYLEDGKVTVEHVQRSAHGIFRDKDYLDVSLRVGLWVALDVPSLYAENQRLRKLLVRTLWLESLLRECEDDPAFLTRCVHS